MAQRQRMDINIYQGDTRSYKFTIYTNTAMTAVWDFSAATAVVLSAKQTLDSDAVLFTATAVNGQNGNDWAAGIMVFQITSANSALLGHNGKYDVQVTISSQKISPVYGDIILQRQVTPT